MTVIAIVAIEEETAMMNDVAAATLTKNVAEVEIASHDEKEKAVGAVKMNRKTFINQKRKRRSKLIRLHNKMSKMSKMSKSQNPKLWKMLLKTTKQKSSKCRRMPIKSLSSQETKPTTIPRTKTRTRGSRVNR